MTKFYMSNHEFWYIIQILTLNGSRVMNFQRIADLAASDWCHVSLGTPSIYLTNLGAIWGIPNLSLTSMAHCQPLWDVFR